MGGVDWLRGEYDFRKREAESHVQEWKAYSARIFDPRPLYFESHRWRPGRLVSQDATFPVASYRYGFGLDGRIWVERQGESSASCYETFFVHGLDGPIESARFDYHTDKRPINLSKFAYSDGLLTDYEGQGSMGCVRSRYIYTQRMLTRIEHETGPSLDALRLFQIEEVRFDESGKLAEILNRQLDAAGREVASELRFKAKPRGLTAKGLETAFLDHLIAAVPSALATLRLTRPIYCLALAYDPEQSSSLPPTIALGLFDQFEKPDSEPWNPATMEQIELGRETFGELHKLADLLDQRPLSASSLRSLMNEAAGRLAKIDWSETMPLTRDFVVYATDLEMADLLPNLRKVLPKDRFEQLKRDRSLPASRT